MLRLAARTYRSWPQRGQCTFFVTRVRFFSSIFEASGRKDESVECVSFQHSENSHSKIGTRISGDGFPASERIHMKASVASDEGKNVSTLAQRMPNDRQAHLAEDSQERNRWLGAQQQLLHRCILFEREGNVLCGAEAGSESDGGESSGIFDDILQDDATPKADSQRCSLSDLIRQHMKAFSSIRKMEKHEADLDVFGHRQEKVSLYLGGGCKYDSDDASMQASHKKTVHFDTHTEAEFSNVQEQKAGRKHCVSHSNLPSQHRKSRGMVASVQRGPFDQRCNNNEGQRNTMMQYCGDDSDSESETENFVSGRNYDKESSLNKKSRHYYHADRPLCPEDVSSATESFGSGRAISKERDKYNKNKHQHAEHEYLDAGPESGVDVYNSGRKHSREGSRYLTSRQGYECFETDTESEIDDLSFRRKNREKCRYGMGRRGHVNIKSLSGVEYETKNYVSERSFFGKKSKSIKPKYHGHTDLDLDGGVVSRASSEREKKAGAVSDRSW